MKALPLMAAQLPSRGLDGWEILDQFGVLLLIVIALAVVTVVALFLLARWAWRAIRKKTRRDPHALPSRGYGWSSLFTDPLGRFLLGAFSVGAMALIAGVLLLLTGCQTGRGEGPKIPPVVTAALEKCLGDKKCICKVWAAHPICDEPAPGGGAGGDSPPPPANPPGLADQPWAAKANIPNTAAAMTDAWGLRFVMEAKGIGDAFTAPTMPGAHWLLFQGRNEKGEEQNVNCTVFKTKGQLFVNVTTWAKTPDGKDGKEEKKEGARFYPFQFDPAKIYTFTVTVKGRKLMVATEGPDGKRGGLAKPLTMSAPFASIKVFNFGNGFYPNGRKIGKSAKVRGKLEKINRK